ncbi:unnamed protein product [Meloidogyne enterolobii]|uniref:Uncharacterized protein n=1 Tax=Meloidogyne enterolobii TaxID=390850 RepID=A0ACB1ASI3_MELEN
MLKIKFILKFFILILIIKLCNSSPWSAYNNPYGMNQGYPQYWNRISPSMMNPYGQYGGRFYGNGGIQGLNPFYGRNTQPINGYNPYNNYFPYYRGQNRFISSLSYPYRTFGGPFT